MKKTEKNLKRKKASILSHVQLASHFPLSKGVYLTAPLKEKRRPDLMIRLQL